MQTAHRPRQPRQQHRGYEWDDNAMGELREVLSDRDVRFLRLLDGLVSRFPRRRRRRVTLFDLERVAALLDGDQLRMVYQPIVDLQGGTVHGFEALARFDVQPARTPEAWFACAKQVGLGLELELKALRAALDGRSRLPATAFLSVNVSASTLLSPELQAILARLHGEGIVIEVTEHEFVEDYEAINETVRGLRSRGFRLAVDDAGSGCAGLAHILSLAPDVIKLDGGIVRDIDRSVYAREMVAAVVVLARYWSSTVVAECIETQAQLDTLLRIGVDRGQGFLLGRPHAP